MRHPLLLFCLPLSAGLTACEMQTAAKCPGHPGRFSLLSLYIRFARLSLRSLHVLFYPGFSLWESRVMTGFPLLSSNGVIPVP